MIEPFPPKGRVTMTRVSPATSKGECWVCGKGKWWHRLFGRFLHAYDPLREESFAEFERLTKKYSA